MRSCSVPCPGARRPDGRSAARGWCGSSRLHALTRVPQARVDVVELVEQGEVLAPGQIWQQRCQISGSGHLQTARQHHRRRAIDRRCMNASTDQDFAVAPHQTLELFYLRDVAGLPHLAGDAVEVSDDVIRVVKRRACCLCRIYVDPERATRESRRAEGVGGSGRKGEKGLGLRFIACRPIVTAASGPVGCRPKISVDTIATNSARARHSAHPRAAPGGCERRCFPAR
jgi:hypothetical protein